jgi:hypothetical protein
MEVNTNRIISLNGINYQAWKSKVKDLLYVKEYWKPMFSIEMPSDVKQYQWEVLNEETRKIADKDGSHSHSEVLVTQS